MESEIRKSEIGFDVGALVIAVIAIVAMMVTYLMPPQLTIFNHKLVVTQGILIPGLLVGAFLWGVIEIYTSHGKGKIDVILRPLVAFIIGAFVGVFCCGCHYCAFAFIFLLDATLLCHQAASMMNIT